LASARWCRGPGSDKSGVADVDPPRISSRWLDRHGVDACPISKSYSSRPKPASTRPTRFPPLSARAIRLRCGSMREIANAARTTPAIAAPGTFAADLTACFDTSRTGRPSRSRTSATERNVGYTLYNHVLTPNRPACKNVHTLVSAASTASSLHPGGVNVLYVDGHVAFASQQIARPVWREFGSIAGEP